MSTNPLHVAILTNEYPPNVYGGAGVHVEYLVRELSRIADPGDRLDVLTFGDQSEASGIVHVQGVPLDFRLPAKDPRHGKLFEALAKNVVMAGSVDRPGIVHCHTWYTHLAGCLIQQLTGARLVLTTHSLEPQRPWKEAQLGSAYQATTWLEKTAYQNADGVIAVSQFMKQSVHELYAVPLSRISVIPNGIDPQQYKRMLDPARVRAYGIDPDRPYVLFVGRITRQKGILHLLRAAEFLEPDTHLVLCAGAADTPELEAEVEARVTQAARRLRVVWIPQMVPREDLIVIYSHAAVFVCPSIYEPFGIINLEAMACGAPVVASAVGGIPDIVLDGKSGKLVPLEPAGPDNPRPRDPEGFARRLAEAIADLLASPKSRAAMSAAGRARILADFTWERVARQTLGYYRQIAAGRRHRIQT